MYSRINEFNLIIYLFDSNDGVLTQAYEIECKMK